MRIISFSYLLLCLGLTAVPSVTGYDGASGGNMAVTYPTAGASLIQGQTVTITWTASGLYSPLIGIELLGVSNDAPDTSNSIKIASTISTSSQKYTWTVGQSFGGGNIIQIGTILGYAYSGSFSIQPAPTTSAANITGNATSIMPSSSIHPNSTSSRLPNSTISTSTIPTTTSPSLTTLPSGSSTLTATSSSSGNSTDPDAQNSSSSNNTATVSIAFGVIAGVLALGGVLYMGLRKTRRRRRPVSMPLILEESSNEPKDWSPPDWTAHNTPVYRKPPTVDRVPLVAGGAPYGGYQYTQSGTLGYSAGNPYYADQANIAGNSNWAPAAVPTASLEPATPWVAASSLPSEVSNDPSSASPVPGAVAIPEEAYIREKTAVATGWQEELEGVVKSIGSEDGGNKPNAHD